MEFILHRNGLYYAAAMSEKAMFIDSLAKEGEQRLYKLTVTLRLSSESGLVAADLQAHIGMRIRTCVRETISRCLVVQH